MRVDRGSVTRLYLTFETSLAAAAAATVAGRIFVRRSSADLRAGVRPHLENS